MALSFGNLSTYTEQNSPLIKKMILGGKFVSTVRIQPGIKSAMQLAPLTSEINVVSNATGWISSGNTNISGITLTVCPLAVKESLDPLALESYWTQVMLKKGSYQDEIPFENLLVEDKLTRIQAAIEDIAIRGNTGLAVGGVGTGNLSKCDGVIALLDNTFSGSTTNVTNSAWTVANSVTILDTLIGSINTDAQLASDLTCYVSYAAYRTILQAYRAANLFSYPVNPANLEDGVIHPGSVNVKVLPIRGLSASATVNRAFLTPSSNIVFGCDLANDYEMAKTWYEESDLTNRFYACWKQGITFVEPAKIVRF